MDIKLSEEQVEINRQARRFFENECPMEFVRTMLTDNRGFTDELWSKVTEMGWPAMSIPDEFEGLGLDLLDLTIVLEEMGRALMPGPFFSSVLLAAEIVKAAGNQKQKEHFLPKLAAGEIIGALACHEPDGGADYTYIRTTATGDGEEYSLTGAKLFVPDAHVADFIICPAIGSNTGGDASPITLFLLPPDAEGVAISVLPTLDGTRKLCALELDNVRLGREHVLGAWGEGWNPLNKALAAAQVGLSAENVGGAQRAMEIAVDYAKIRIQFDQPIGSFQAIKHRCAQMYADVESARSITYWAAWAQDHTPQNEAALAASAAKSFTSEVYREVTAGALQVLGATGFTWEHDIHLYLKRAKANEVLLGDPHFHREQVVAAIEG